MEKHQRDVFKGLPILNFVNNFQVIWDSFSGGGDVMCVVTFSLSDSCHSFTHSVAASLFDVQAVVLVRMCFFQSPLLSLYLEFSGVSS